MINPTGKKTRSDSEGSGDYQANRGSRKHSGRDYEVDPGGPVYSPIAGTIVRIAYPYRDDLRWKGVIIQGKSIAVRMYYLELDAREGSHVRKGEQIGVAQDLRARYGNKMTPHIHLEIESMDPDVLINLSKAILGG